MQVRLATYADKDAWDAYVLRQSGGTAYQLFAWREAVEEAYAFKAYYLVAETDTRICGLLPLIDFRIPLLGRNFISLPYCDAGGVLADSQEVEDALISYACSMAAEAHAGIKFRSSRSLLSCGQNQTDKVSLLLTLPGNSESLLANFKSSLRSQIKKPERDGLTVQTGTGELIDAFYKVFTANMRDLGSPVHARLWFQAIVAAYAERVRVAVVYSPDKRPVAAGMILLHSSKVSIPWASSLLRDKRLNPNMLLYWTFLSYAADNGYSVFDFGRSTPGDGTFRFKSQWGAKPCQLYWYGTKCSKAGNQGIAQNDPLRSDIPSTGRHLAVSLWQRLPQSGANWFGPKIRKYISL